jgi:hypothetical protein
MQAAEVRQLLLGQAPPLAEVADPGAECSLDEVVHAGT